MVMTVEVTSVDREMVEAWLRDDWLTRRDAALLARTSGEYIWQLGRAGKIEVLTTPAGVLYSRTDIERMAAAREGKGE